MTTVQAGSEDLLAGVKIIDGDGHISEPPDLWTSHVARSMKDRVPVMRTLNGTSAWYLNNELWAGLGGNCTRRGGQKDGAVAVQPWEEIDPLAWDPKARLNLLDELGLYGQILYPNAMGFAGHMTFSIKDLDQRNTILSTYNDFLVDVQHESDRRLFPQVLLPMWDMELTVKEMTRLRNEGITGFTISDKPNLLDLPGLDNEYWAPMWELGNEMGAVFNFHVASGKAPDTMGSTVDKDEAIAATMEAMLTGGLSRANRENPFFESLSGGRRSVLYSSIGFISNARIISNLCMSNLFDRYPNIKIVSAESGIGWVPFILEALEYGLDELGSEAFSGDAVPKRRPTEYFRDHIYVMFWFEKIAPAKLIEHVGVNNVLVETDVPHPTCFYPDPRGRFASATKSWDDHTRRRVFQDNAAELYGIPLPG